MNTTGPLEILVIIVLLLVVIACVAICVVAVRWLRRIAMQVEEEQVRRREREEAAAEREAEAAARQAEAAERERIRAAAEDDRLQAEHQSAEDLQQIRRRAALADEEAAQAKAEAARAEAEAARALLELTQIRIETEEAHAERGRAAQSPVGRDEKNESGVSPVDDETPGGVGDLVPGEIADLLRHLGLPTGWGDGARSEDVSAQGIDPRLLRRLQGLIPPEVMRRLASGHGPGDIESIGDWIRSQIEKSMREGRDGPSYGRQRDRPAGFQRTDPADEDPAVSGNEPESRDVSDGRPDAPRDDQSDVRVDDLPDDLADDVSGVAADPAAATSGGLDVAALIEEALRDRDRRRSEGAGRDDSVEPDGDN